MKINAVDFLIFAVICILFHKPLLYIFKVIIKGLLYSVLIYGINFITAAAGITVGVNLISTLLCGIFGIYGVFISYLSSALYSLGV